MNRTDEAAALLAAASAPAVTLFSDNQPTPGSPAPSVYLWSDPANWSDGLPGNSSNVHMSATGTEDMAGLALSTATIAAGEVLYTIGDLSAGTLSVGDNATVV